MDLSIYSRSRKFKLLHLKTTERVGGEAVLWALIGGPLYFWKKGAMIEALVIGTATLPFWAIDTEGYLLDGIGGLVWLAAVLFAPVLLAMSYQRRGWTDVTDRPGHSISTISSRARQLAHIGGKMTCAARRGTGTERWNRTIRRWTKRVFHCLQEAVDAGAPLDLERGDHAGRPSYGKKPSLVSPKLGR